MKTRQPKSVREEKKQAIIRDIQRVSYLIGSERVKQNDYKKHGKKSVSQVRYYFATWNEAVKAAGLVPNLPGEGREKLSDENLLKEIGNLWELHGKMPSGSLMNLEGEYTTSPYRSRWGTFSAAIKEFIARKASLGYSEIRAEVHTTSYKPHQVSQQPNQVYGELINFRGLSYGPVNEQGVVHLFAKVSHELDFRVEHIRTAFPDCEALRKIKGNNGKQWERVYIEFEYKSSNFIKHGHDPESCNIIVCWIHDWEDAPIEVIELKSVISDLPAGDMLGPGRSARTALPGAGVVTYPPRPRR